MSDYERVVGLFHYRPVAFFFRQAAEAKLKERAEEVEIPLKTARSCTVNLVSGW
jgi:hypothetical protein